MAAALLLSVIFAMAGLPALRADTPGNTLSFPSAPAAKPQIPLDTTQTVPAISFAGVAAQKNGAGQISHQTVAHADLGHVARAGTTALQVLFTLQNQSVKPLTLGRLTPSCGCTTARVLYQTLNGSNHTPSVDGLLEPNETATVLVSIDLQQVSGPQFLKTVMVYAGISKVPAAELVVTGQLPDTIGTVVSSTGGPHATFHYTPGNTLPVSSQTRIDMVSIKPQPPTGR